MAGNRDILWTRLGRLGLGAQALLISAVLLVAWLAAAPLAYELSGNDGLVASLIGAVVCWTGALLALAIAACLHGPAAAMYSMLLGMFARAFVPLLLGVVLHLQFPELASSGMIFYLLSFYLVALVAETVLLLAQIPRVPTS
jgi:hypothetical protein